MIKYIGIYLFSVFISSVAQILLKLSAEKEHKNIWKEYLNPWVFFAYGIFLCSSLLTILAYRYVPLSMGPVIESTGYIFVSVLGYVCLHETIGKRKAVGIVCIFAGVIISCM